MTGWKGKIEKEIMQEIVALVLLFVGNTLGANILFMSGVPSYSHHLFNVKYLEALVASGHRVTYVGVDKYDPPENMTHVLMEGAYSEFEKFDFTQLSQDGPYKGIFQLYQWDEEIAKGLIKTKGFARLKEILKKEKFDLVVHDVACTLFLFGAVDVAGRPPAIGITAYGIPPSIHDILGNPLSHAARPNFYSPYTNEMSLLERVDNYFLNLFSSLVFWYQIRTQNEYAQKFGNVRHLSEILNDVNIIITNSNHAIDYPFPKVPGLIQIAGIQIVKPKPLPQDLQTYLDNAKHGVIYFSLGTNVKSSLLKAEKIQILIEAFRQLAPVQVLWKWEKESLPGKPDNVVTRKWLSQNDVLAHPNVRLFFTHCGGLSSNEAIYYGKPIVGMPFLLDQHVLSKKASLKGIGEILDFDSLTVDGVVNAIKKVLNEPRYTENVRRLSAVYRDEIGTPLERAVFWTEYAIRHKGASHLRFAGRDLHWYQNWMVDVILFLSAGVFGAVFVIYKITTLIVGSNRGGQKTKTKRS